MNDGDDRGDTMAQSNTFTLALVQVRCGVEAAQDMSKAEHRVRHAAAAGAQIVCRPQLVLSPYFGQKQDISLFDLAEPIPRPSAERLSRLAKDTGTVVVASLFERRS